MKKLIIAVVLAVFCTAGSMVFAQEEQQQTKKNEKDSEYYYLNVSIEKIYPYRSGYVVMYRKGINQMARAYLPIKWFTGSAGKGEIVNLPQGSAWPSMSVYYKDGEFSHVRLYVHRTQSHLTWGVLPQSANLDEYFEEVEDLQLYN